MRYIKQIIIHICQNAPDKLKKAADEKKHVTVGQKAKTTTTRSRGKQSKTKNKNKKTK